MIQHASLSPPSRQNTHERRIFATSYTLFETEFASWSQEQPGCMRQEGMHGLHVMSRHFSYDVSASILWVAVDVMIIVI